MQRLHDRAGYHRMVAGDEMVGTDPEGCLVSLNDFTLHNSPELYYEHPDLIKLRHAYEFIARVARANRRNPEQVVLRLERYSARRVRDWDLKKKIAFVRFEIEQVVENNFDVRLLDADSTPHPETAGWDLFDNQVVRTGDDATREWRTSKTLGYPSLDLAMGRPRRYRPGSAFDRVREFGDTYGEKLIGSPEDIAKRFLEPAWARQEALGASWLGDREEGLKRSRVFVSYNQAGREFAERISELVRTRGGYDVWFDSRELVAGDPLESKLIDAIRHSRAMLVLHGPHGLSKYQTKEVEWTRVLESGRRIRIIPIWAPGCTPPKVEASAAFGERIAIDLRSDAPEDRADELFLALKKAFADF